MDNRIIGQTIEQKYVILSVLGQGGLGTVYKAKHLHLNRFAAIKFLHRQDNQLSEGDAARFEREAKILAALQHEHIVAIYGFGVYANQPYMAMGYLDGITLSEFLGRAHEPDFQRIIKIIIQICQALEEAHKNGIVHRDLKPQNIMLLEEPYPDCVKVLDFGLSKLLFDSIDAEQKLTKTGALIGTVHYMSPEMCSGQKADQRSDIYSLGCILYQCLSGQLPFEAEHPIGLLHKQINEQPKALSKSVPELLVLVTFKALQKDPNKRFQSMSELEKALSLIRDGKEDLLVAALEQSANTSKTYRLSFALKAISSIALILVLLLSANFSLTRKQNDKTKVGKRTAPVQDSRTKNIARAKRLVREAQALLVSGNESEAKDRALRALLTIAKPYKTRTREAAVGDLDILKSLPPVLKYGSSETLPLEQIYAVLKANDETLLDSNQRVQFYLALSDIRMALGGLFDSLDQLLFAFRLLLTEKKYDEFQGIIEARRERKEPSEDIKIAMDCYLTMGEAELNAARGNRAKAVLLADRTKKLADRSELFDEFQKYKILFELSYFYESQLHDNESAFAVAQSMMPTIKRIQNQHPDALYMMSNQLVKYYRNKNDLKHAIAEARRMKVSFGSMEQTIEVQKFSQDTESILSSLEYENEHGLRKPAH